MATVKHDRRPERHASFRPRSTAQSDERAASESTSFRSRGESSDTCATWRRALARDGRDALRTPERVSFPFHVCPLARSRQWACGKSFAKIATVRPRYGVSHSSRFSDKMIFRLRPVLAIAAGTRRSPPFQLIASQRRPLATFLVAHAAEPDQRDPRQEAFVCVREQSRDFRRREYLNVALFDGAATDVSKSIRP